jgi:two-component system, NtrC family, response regulator PilR
MVVDDEPGIRTALRANFLRHGWRVETASMRARSNAHSRRSDFDLVVTDIRMPDGRHGCDALCAPARRPQQPSFC